MAHPKHCGGICCLCHEECALDESMPCLPDCEGLNPITGKPDSEICQTCDAFYEN